MVLCGISRCFHLLSPCLGQIAHALLTRPPLEYQFPFRRTSFNIPARLACVKHAASVRPEPGSNSDVQSFILSSPTLKTGSPKPIPQLGSNKRFTLPNLTVSCTVCTFSVSFSRIALSGASLADSLFSISKHPCFVKPFFGDFTICLLVCEQYSLFIISNPSFGA